MFRCSYTIIRERIHSCLLKLQLLIQSINVHWCVVNTVVHQCTLMDYFNNCNFSKHELVHSLMMV
jgi:hypothetical protein